MADHAVCGPVGEDGIRLPFRVDEVPWEEYFYGTRSGSPFRQLGEYGCSHVGVRLTGEGYRMADAMGSWDGEEAPGVGA